MTQSQAAGFSFVGRGKSDQNVYLSPFLQLGLISTQDRQECLSYTESQHGPD